MRQGVRRTIAINGTIYPTVIAAKQDTGLCYRAIQRLLQQGEAQDLTQHRAVIRSDGKRYPLISDAAKDNFVCWQAIYRAIKYGTKSNDFYWSWEESKNNGRS